MQSEFEQVGWIGQAIIAAIGSTVGAFIGLCFVPIAANLHANEAGYHAIWAWCIASCGAIAGGLVFSWIKDR